MLANIPSAYRETTAAALRAMRPDVEVIEVDPDDVDGAVARVRPRLVICSRITTAIQRHAGADFGASVQCTPPFSVSAMLPCGPAATHEVTETQATDPSGRCPRGSGFCQYQTEEAAAFAPAGGLPRRARPATATQTARATRYDAFTVRLIPKNPLSSG